MTKKETTKVAKVAKVVKVAKTTAKTTTPKVIETVKETTKFTEEESNTSENLIEDSEELDTTLTTPEVIISTAMAMIESTFEVTVLNRGLYGSMYNTLKEARRLAKDLK